MTSTSEQPSTTPSVPHAPGEVAPGTAAAAGDEAEAPDGPIRPQHLRRLRHRRRTKLVLAVVLVVVAVLVTVVGVERATQPVGLPDITTVRHSEVVPGTARTPPWPPGGQAAVAIPALGYAAQSGPETPVPVASLAKMATAVVILRDHPIPPGASGPLVPVDADDAAQFGVDLDNDETTIPLQVGESITELQLLQALLVASANDAAYTLADWDSGSQSAFVAKMNALAVSLRAFRTDFVDSSGYQPQSVSTVSDMLRIAAAGMAIPTFAALVDEPTATVPLAGVITNVVTLIGTDGIIGVKSGYTSQASGCMVLASDRSIDGQSVLVLAAALGQHVPLPPAPAPPSAPGAPATTTTTTRASTTTTTTVPYNPLEAEYPLLYTGPIVERLLYAAEREVTAVTLARARAGDGDGERRLGGVGPDGSGRRHGQGDAVRPSRPAHRGAARSPAAPHTGYCARPGGSVRFVLGAQSVVVPVARDGAVAPPDWMWKLLHG